MPENESKKTEENLSVNSRSSLCSEKLPELKPGMTVRVYQKIREVVIGDDKDKSGEKKTKERTQIFEGIILAVNKGKKPGPTILVRKISEGIGVEKIFPLNSPTIIKIKPLKQAKVRRAKLYYLRDYPKRLKEKRITNK